MEQRLALAPAPAGESPSAQPLDQGLPTDPHNLTVGHLDSAFDALAAILRSPQAHAAGKRPYEALRDAMRQLDHYLPYALERSRLTAEEAGLA
jgi:hypothetical protein